MAFFGLTQVGPQNQFQAAVLDAMDITLFSEEEFRAAFTKLDRDRSGFIETGEVRPPLCELL
jgi:Ca2+-binding EF-hand superfamily protein